MSFSEVDIKNKPETINANTFANVVKSTSKVVNMARPVAIAA